LIPLALLIAIGLPSGSQSVKSFLVYQRLRAVKREGMEN